MANPIPDLMTVKYKGGGNVQVFLLQDGITLGAQDGSNVPSAQESTAPDANNQANRICEAFGKRYLLHTFHVYERDFGGDGNWGEVTVGLGLSAPAPLNGAEHSGLFVLYPGGVQTLAWLCSSGGMIHAISTTDGVNWSNATSAAFYPCSLPDSQGASIVFRDSIFWLARSSSNGATIHSYDFRLGVGNGQYVAQGTNTPHVSHSFHVHQNNLYMFGRDTASANVWRLDGVSWTILDNIAAHTINIESATCLFSDGDDLIALYTNDTSDNQKAWRLSNLLPGDSLTKVDISTALLSPIAGTAKASYYPFVATAPDPSAAEQRTYFWYRVGDANAGAFALYRFNYRVITTGMHTGAFSIGEIVTGGTSGAMGLVTDIVVDTSLSMTDVTGTFVDMETLTGDVVGVSAATSALADVAVTSLGIGPVGINFGLPSTSAGGAERIPAAGNARPAFSGTPTEQLGNLRRRPFVVYGTGADIDLALYFSNTSEAPDQRGTIAAVSIADVPVTTGLVGNLSEAAIEALGGELFTGLEGYWKGEDGTDSSGNALTLTTVGTVPYTGTGKFGNAPDFPAAAGSRLERSINDTSLNIGAAAFSISCWVDPVSIANLNGSTRRVICSKADLNIDGWYLSVSDTGAVFFDSWDGGAGVGKGTGVGVITTGSLQHILVTSDFATIKIYVNGVEEHSTAAPATVSPTANVFLVGAWQSNDNARWEGVIDEVAIWSRYLTPGEAALLYSAGSGLELPAATLHSSGDAYVVSATDGDFSLIPGALAISVGDIVEYDGANWAGIYRGLSGSLEAYYTFEGNALDSSGNGLDLTMNGSVPFIGGGVLGNAADFSGGVSDWLSRVGDDAALDLGQAFAPWSVQAWVNPTALGGALAEIAEKSNNASDGWQLGVSPDGSVRMRFNGGAEWKSNPGDISTGSLQHIVATSDGTTFRIYVGGSEVDQMAAVAITNSSSPFLVGRRTFDTATPWNGLIDELAIWSRCLSVTEIGLLNNSGSARSIYFGFAVRGTHATLSATTALIAPYTDGADDGKLVAFDGTSLIGIVATTPIISNNEIQGVTPTNGVTTYYLDHNSPADGLFSGDRLSLTLDII